MFGSMLLPFSVTLYGHVLGAALGFGAWLVLDGDDRPHGRAWLAGGLIGVAVLVEYQVAIVALVLAAALAVATRWGDLGRYVAAGAPFGLVLAVYQHAAFGSPFRSGYGTKAVHEGASSFVTGIPRFTTTWSFLFGSRGMLVFTPIVAVGLVGLVLRWRSRREAGVVVAMAVCLGFVLLQAGWPNPWGGETPGPRYVIPMLPFLGLGVAHVWHVVPAPLRRGVAVVSLSSMVLASVTSHLMGDGSVLIGEHLGRLVREGPEPTLFTMAFGPLGWVPHLLIVAAVLRLIWLRVRSSGLNNPSPTPIRPPCPPTDAPAQRVLSSNASPPSA